MQNLFVDIISKELSLAARNVANVLTLFDEGATIPFISRYRKEMTGSMDEVQVGAVKERYEKLQEIEKRKESILKSMDEQGVLTDELESKIKASYNLTELEDIYLPYKPKRKTRAVKAREKGLEPLAKIIMKQHERDVEGRAASFVNKEVANVEEALQGARDIIAEWINEHKVGREIVRSVFEKEAVISSKLVKGKEEEAAKYKDYFEWSEPLKKCPSHRYLAMRRGEKEGYLKLNISPDAEYAMERLDRFFVKGDTDSAAQVQDAVTDAYKRLLAPSIETEFSNLFKEKSDEEAIKVFTDNLRQLLLASPLGQKRVLALDPGYRTGCKVVCLDQYGDLLENATIYPHPPQNDYKKSSDTIIKLVAKHKIEAIAIGNGTASRETEAFAKGLSFAHKVEVFVVSEDGASVYSAGKVAREEFPDYDVTVRGAVSIGRRLMDPLAELVKIDPKSIGVGQYQHDVDQSQLKKSLDTVVESCVNSVGVNLNTASKHLLTYVSGLGPQLAQNIVDYRSENGAFTSRDELKKVTRLGAKAYEQSAGFLRISSAKNPLDNTAVHPESYKLVKQMAKDLHCEVADLIKDKTLRSKVDLQRYVTDKVGLPTLNDIMQELDKPGRDPREAIKAFSFAEGIYSIDDLHEGMELPGLVTNITKFGAFVDVGVKQDGLVHISQLANQYVSDPNQIVKLQQQVKVRVLEIDHQRKRIQLSMKGLN
ncbi:Tex family protein [Carboxylicivirga linearis]|uniref:RNA-binding transcriptional accessory protein n=1 Tax=Carboxylicivirga linearis TaxID=1628157 RepID=A0ABS5JSZ5_9BACT|nr:Tex family protein [Carboxylicivirga linearis]MBS2098028.1 RNA-binding transcriptional accessory protein [Carboxylicivirga linearis]